VVTWYRKAAEQGNADAQYSLGFMYENGRGVPRDDTAAASWYQKAAEQGNARLYDQPVLVIDPGMHTAPIRSADVDAAGRVGVTGSIDKTVRVWSLADGRLLRTIHFPAGPANAGKIYAVPMALSLLPAGETRWSPTTREYSLETDTGRMAARIAGLPELTYSLAFSPDGRYLAAGLISSGLRVYDRNRQWSEAFHIRTMASVSMALRSPRMAGWPQ
jgi:WD40 repeat protein